MLVTKREVKQTSKKLLSLLLAVVMIMTSMSVGFATVANAVGGNATEAQWTALVGALKNDIVKGATFTGTANNYEVDDPDGKILAAVEAYYAVFNAMSNKTPTNQTPSNGSSDISKTGESSDTAKRTINQLNTTIKNELSSRMGADYDTYGVNAFLTGLLCGANISADTSNKEDSNQNASVPATPLSAAPSVNLKVKLGSAVTGYTLEELKALTDGVVAEKTFTVTHANSNYDYAYDYTAATSGCTGTPASYKHTFYFYYNVNANVAAVDGAKKDVSAITKAAATLEANSAYFSYTLEELVSAGFNDTSVITDVKAAVNGAKTGVVDAFTATAWNHFFSSYDVVALSNLIDKAVTTIEACKLAMDMDAIVDEGYADIITDKAALVALSQDIKTKTDKYDAYAADIKTFVETHEYNGEIFSRQAVTDFYNAILREIELIELRVIKDDIATKLPIYNGYNEENVTDGTVDDTTGVITNSTVTGGHLDIAIGTVQGWINAIGTYDSANVAIVWEGIDVVGMLTTHLTELRALKDLAKLNEGFAAEYSNYVTAVFANTNLDADSAELLAAIQGYDSWYTGIKKTIADIEATYDIEIADAIIEGHDEIMKAHLDSKYNALHARSFAQIDLADKLYKELVKDGKVSVLNVNTYAEFEDALGHVEVDLYNFLLNSTNFDMPQLTIDEFNEIWTLALGDYHSFVTSGGFDRYETTNIPDIVRPEAETDNHGAHIGDYTVTDANVEKIIDIIEKLLADEDIKAILGDLVNKDKETGEPTGEPFDLAALINGLLEGIYTDDLINTIVQYVYPLVAKEFAKVWAGIDPHVVTKADVMSGVTADIDTNLALYDVETAIAGVGIYLAPKTLAAHLKSVTEYAVYTDVISVLESGKTVTKYDFKDKDNEEDDVYTDAWADENLFVTVYEKDENGNDKLDENGNLIPVLNDDGTPKQVLNLDWGIENATDKRAAFIDAACAALSGLEPLLFALISNQHFVNPNTSSKPNDVRGCKIGVSGSPSTASISGISLQLVLDPITLMFDITGNDGYDNVLAPIFEALGCTNIPHGEELTTTRKILEDGLFGMLDQVIAKVAAEPLTTILEILPNIAYALSVDRIKPLLSNLEIEIYYEADAYYSADIPSWASWLTSLLGLPDPVTGAMQGAMKAEEDKDGDGVKEKAPVKINIGEMINLEDMGLDLSFAGIWDMIMGMLPEGVSLPKLDAGYLATLGELTWKDTNRSKWTYTPVVAGKAAYIEANKADVLIYLLRYVFSVVQNETAFTGLLNALVTKEVQDTNEDGSLKFENDKPVMIKVPDEEKIAELMTNLTDFGLFNMNADNAIAAVVELLNQVEYDTLKEYVWYASELDEDTVVGLTPAIQQYLAYDNDWTKEKADYIIDNVDEIITAVLAMVNKDKAEDEKVSFDLGAMLGDLISGLFTNKTVTALAKVLGGLDLNALLAGDAEESAEEPAIDINALVAKFAGIDLSAYAQYADLAEDEVLDFGFEDGDKDGFVNALVALLAPLQGVIDFILADKDLQLLGGDVTLVGYNGYDSAIVPILEALGATPAALQDSDNVLAVVIGALVARVESLDSVDAILNLIPGVLYFIKSNGLTTAVRNLLQPVLVILETIDPIYALNLGELISGLTKDLGFTINLDDLSFGAIFDILGGVVDLDLTELEEIIDDVCEVIVGKEYKSASSVIGENGKRGAYGEYFDAADLVTVLLSFALSWLQEGDNANDIVNLIAGDDAEKAEEITKYINGAIVIINGIEPEYESINWAYHFPDGFDEAIFESGIAIQPTINTITYPTNWTEDTAKYVADNLAKIADEIIANVEIDGVKYESIAKLVDAKVAIYSTENVDAIIKVVADLLKDIDEVLINTVGSVLGADIAALKAYKAPEGIDTAEEFAAALTEALATIQPVVDWLLFGEDYAFFSKGDKDLVTIKGSEGYAYGLAPILEALGVAAPAKDEATVESVLEAVFARVDAILADPINEVFELLPNIIYFLNANGVSTSVKNLLAGITALTDTISEEFGLELDLMKVFNDLIAGLLPEDTTVTLDVENLDLESIFALVQELLGLDLTPIANILVDLCVGQIVAYKSANGEYGFKMLYTDDFAKYDMITIVASCLLQIIKLEANAEALKEMLGENIYEGILNILSLDVNVPVQDFDWALTDKADTGEVFSALQSSELYGNHEYGPLYTKEMEQYISDNFGEFVDNIVYLLGLEINGSNVESLTDLLNGLVGGSVYNSDMIIKIRDAIAGVAGTLEKDFPAGAHILEILKLAEIADLKAVADVKVPEFADDRAAFVSALCDVLEPLYGALKWLLADEDLTFFIDEEKNTVITLPGAEGYAYGLIPVLEVLDCEGIIAPDAYYAAIDGGNADTIITALINPILDRVDEILAAPADEILSILPNLIYFINSNGVDTVVKNTLNAVYTLLNAIEPIAKVDLYEIIGLDLATIDFDWLFDKLLEIIKDATGYEFDALDANAIVELTVGTLESYTSLSGKTAYRMIYQSAEAKGEMVTVVLRLAITFIMHENNRAMLLGLLRDNLGMSAEAEKYVELVLNIIADCAVGTRLGMDTALATIYYIFYGADIGVGETTGGYNSLNDAWREALKELREESNIAADLIEEILGSDIFEDIIDPEEGIAPNGFIAFFQKIASWFQKIIDFFKGLFS